MPPLRPQLQAVRRLLYKVCHSVVVYQTSVFNRISIQQDVRSDPTCRRGVQKRVGDMDASTPSMFPRRLTAFFHHR